MALSMSRQLQYWGIAAAVFLGGLWLLHDILLPFVLGAALAYFLDPVADRLEAAGLPRIAATALIAVLFIAVFVLAGLLVIPTIVSQAVQLVEAAPAIFRDLQAFLEARFPDIVDAESPVRQSIGQIGQAIGERGGALLQGLLTSAQGLVGAVVFLLIAPVVAFYLLLDWNRLIDRADTLLPREHAPVIRRLARDIDRAIAGFVRGQLTVCMILAVYYAGALMLAGLNYGLVVGVVTGMISFIPFIGAIVGGALAFGLALFQFWGDWLAIGIVVAVFFGGQALEGNVLVPKLVGGAVGLHPVWLLLALSAFGALFGFTGVLMAVPVAAALGVVVRFLVARYRASQLYRGPEVDVRVPDAAPLPEGDRPEE